MIKFDNITKIFKSDIIKKPFVALDSVSFEIPTGSMVGFLGANGAGKTTSLKIIMDFIRPSNGTVNFFDLGKNRKEIFKQIGFLPERPYFYSNLTGFEFLFFMGNLSEVETKIIHDRINFWAPKFKIDHALKREIKTYSKGMLQRIGFLSTILHDPKLIILDEPLSGLDPIGRKELKDVIVDVHKTGKTVFFSSHIVSDIEEICDRVVFLKDGKLTFDGKIDTLIKSSVEKDYILKIQTDKNLNIKTNYKSIETLPNSLKHILVEPQHKLALISELISNDVEILALEQNRLTLEEIFYQVKKNE